MTKLSKDQQRKQKVSAKRKVRDSRQRCIASAELRKIRNANKKITEAIEVAVARAVKEYCIPDLAARTMIADILRDYIFITAQLSAPVAQPQEPIVSQPREKLLETSTKFNKDAWVGAAVE